MQPNPHDAFTLPLPPTPPPPTVTATAGTAEPRSNPYPPTAGTDAHALERARRQALLACGLGAASCVLTAAEPLEAGGGGAPARFELPWRVLTFARVAVMDEGELRAHWHVLSGDALSAANERRALRWLGEQCARVLRLAGAADALVPARPDAPAGGNAARMLGVWREALLWLLRAYRAEALARLDALAEAPVAPIAARPRRGAKRERERERGEGVVGCASSGVPCVE
ncbi:hypothetical protein KFE25_010767 [Diacronema lutheri]|uniref:Rubisco LSMT substrate-binding domain-containing protein n=1 Tax=Diacronema lutheri TaxID=2081491 RepID=A0A8J5XGU6_DIALT|nr:hypothetical protein KFE25_010767 [Diacronema lutheri]